MGFGDFQLNNNGKKEQLRDVKQGVRKEQLDKKYHALFDAYDANKDGTLEAEELNGILKGLQSFAGADKVLDSNENLQAKSIFASEANIQDVDFQGFVKSVSKASVDIVNQKEVPTSDGGKEVTTTYKDGTTETIAFYSNGDYKWKKTEKRTLETSFELIIDGKKYKFNDETKFKKALETQYQKSISNAMKNEQNKIATEGGRPYVKLPVSKIVKKIFSKENIERKEFYSPRYIAETLGVNIETEDGKKVVERLSQLPQETLEKLKDGKELKELISSQEFEPTFDNISNVLEITEGVTLRNEEEYKATEAQRQEILTQIKAANFMANVYETIASYNDQYTDSVGLFGLGSEGIGYVLNKLGLDGENHYQFADSCREWAKNASELKVLNPQKFKEGFKNIYGDNAKNWGIDYNSEAFKKCFALAESGKAYDKDNKMTEEYKDAILKAMNIVADDPNDSTYNQVMNDFGEALIIIATLGWGAETKAGITLAMSTMGTFSKAGVAIASKQVNNKLLQGALRFSGQAVKLVGPALNEGTKMYLYTATEGTVMNVSNRAIKQDGFDKLFDTQAQVMTNANGSFDVGVFAGAFGFTVTQKVMQYASKTSSKVTTVLADKFSKGAVDANEVFATILEKSAPTKIAEVAAFATDVVGFTAFESALTIANTLQREGTLTPEKLADTLMEEFGHQGYSLGQIKVISHLIMMLTGSRSARIQSQKYLQENLPQLKGATVESVNGGKDGFKINLPNGKKVECKNAPEMISSLQLMVRGETALSRLFDNKNKPSYETVAPKTQTTAENKGEVKVQETITQNATTKEETRVIKNTDGTFNIKDGNYYWRAENDEQVSFLINHMDKRKKLSGTTIKEKVANDGSKSVNEVDSKTGKVVRKTKVNLDGSIEYMISQDYENGVLIKRITQYSDNIIVTDFRQPKDNSYYCKESEIHPNGQKDVTLYNSNYKVLDQYSIQNIELKVSKDGKYVTENNIEILMKNFDITERSDAAKLLENVSEFRDEDSFLKILSSMNEDNKSLVLHLLKNKDMAYFVPKIMEHINNVNKDVLEYAAKVLNVDEFQLYDFARLLDEVNVVQISDALKKGEDISLVQKKYRELKNIYDPIMRDVSVTDKVEFVQNTIHSFEQDLSKFTNAPLKYSNLLSLKFQNEEKYNRILNSGLIEALESGIVKNANIIPKNADADLTPEIYSDLKLIKEGKSIVKEFSANTDIDKAYKTTSMGDIVEVGNQMYINDGAKLVKWKMTKEMFLKLFPPVERYAFEQKGIGDCYLLSSISSVMRNKRASVEFYKSFEYDGKDVKVTVAAYKDFKGSKSYIGGELKLDKYIPHVEACKGIQLYERTYAKVALRDGDVVYPETAKNDELMQRIDGGNSAQSISEILGIRIVGEKNDFGASDMMVFATNSIPVKLTNSNIEVEIDQLTNKREVVEVLDNFKQNNPNTTINLFSSKPENIKTIIEYLSNDADVVLNFGTKHDLQANDVLEPRHAHSIVGYDKSTGLVKIVNPHNSSNIKEIHIDELSRLIKSVYITNIPQLSYQMKSKIKAEESKAQETTAKEVVPTETICASEVKSEENLEYNAKTALIDVLSAVKTEDGVCVFNDEIKLLNNFDAPYSQLKEVISAIKKQIEKRNLNADNNEMVTRIKNALSIVSNENHPDVKKMNEFSKNLDKMYARMIESEVNNTFKFILGDVEIEKNGKFYIAKDENGVMSARSKSSASIFSKIRKKVLALKTDIPKNKEQADVLIGDAGGFRYTINRVGNGVAQKIISDIVPKSERIEFNKYFKESYKLTLEEKIKINPKFVEYEKNILEKSIHAQSDVFVAKLCEGIETGKISLQEINNYCGHEGIPYFSQEHIQKITVSYNKWFDKMSKNPNFKVTIDEVSGLIECIEDKYGNKFRRVLPIENSQENPSAIKESGYTSSQFNIIGENGLRIEFQYRSSEINKFAEFEHVPYDIREGKETVNDSKYDKIRNVLTNKKIMSDDEYKKFYNPYLTQVYNYYRRVELGLPVGEMPVLNKNDFKNLTQEDLDLISVDGLRKLHEKE